MLNQCPFSRGRVAIVGERHFKPTFGTSSFQFTYSITCYLDDVDWSLMPLPNPKHDTYIYITYSTHFASENNPCFPTWNHHCANHYIDMIYIYIHSIFLFYNTYIDQSASVVFTRWGLRSYFAEAISENVTVPPETSLDNFTHWLLGKARRGWFGVLIMVNNG